MKIKSGFVLEEVGGSYLAVAVGDRAAEYRVLIKLNKSAAFLWSLIAEEDKSAEELISALISEYDVDRQIAERDVTAFYESLKKGGLLDE